jgi:hypothetical protein
VERARVKRSSIDNEKGSQALGASRRRMSGSFLHLKAEHSQLTLDFILIYIPSYELVFVQLFISTNIESANDFRSTRLRLIISFPIGFAQQVILKISIFVFVKKKRTIGELSKRYHSGNHSSQFFPIDLSVIRSIASER